MVGFGKTLREHGHLEWKQYYINYKMLKKKLKRYVQGQQSEGEEQMRKEFARLLDLQVEKIVLFLLEQEGYLASLFAALGKERDMARESGDPSTIAQCIKAYRAVGLELLQLLQFVEFNATGLRKILKKFDKRVAYRLTNYYVLTRANHPFSQLQQVFRHVGIEAMLGSLTRSLAELTEGEKSFYDDPTSVQIEDPVIHSIKGALERLTHSTRFLSFLSKHALIDEEDELLSLENEAIKQQYDYMALVLNLMNTFLYMVNTYIIVPSADKYAFSLGAAPTVCGIIIGSMAVAQLVSSVYLSAWSNTSYFRPLTFSSIVLLLGNVLYAVAYDCKSLSILIVGRLLCGLGSARAVNRRYITDWVPANKRLQASAAFVSASALGMAVGPALAGLFETNKRFLGLTINANTLPGLVMAGCWLIYLVWLWFGFKEPVRTEDGLKGSILGPSPSNENVDIDCLIQGLDEDSLHEPLLVSTVDVEDEEYGEEADQDSAEDLEDMDKPANSFCEALKLLTNPVKVQLGIYFMLKYAMEIILSESSVITSYYFGWATGTVAIFLALLGCTVLPVNFLVSTYISDVFEDRQILLASEVMTCIGIAISFVWPVRYTAAQYVIGSLITFVSAEVLEGVNLALLSKVMSPRLARGTYNNGLLSTEAGTLARVVADGTITLVGYYGMNMLLNLTLAPALLIGLVSLVATFFCYKGLY
ncbi:hypothetical protein GOP47_0006930 [Adiantum capillus-veneris]|uniref:SPX domain-containing protein n=1 Tax=Adiantum capillus-veneris TaxID=13818 RepID=A0A9D4V0A0_ADICA|nr:hypothetical protein GOP47_0006930 [Adiantum capillus-veneris]